MKPPTSGFHYRELHFELKYVWISVRNSDSNLVEGAFNMFRQFYESDSGVLVRDLEPF